MISISSQLSGIIEGKEKIPYGYAAIYDTTNTVPSSGFFVRYYSGLNPISASLKRTQFENSIFTDWGGGIPIELSKYINVYATNSGINLSDPYMIIYSGFYNSEVSGLYTFGARTNGSVQIYISGNPVLTSSGLIRSPSTYGTSEDVWAGRKLDWNGTYNLNSGWTEYKLVFKWFGITSGLDDTPFLAAYHKTPSMVEEEPMTAGYVNTTTGFITPTILTNLMFFREEQDTDLSTQVSFEVSVTPSGKYAWSKALQDFGIIKNNRLCEIYLGYVTQSGYSYTSGYTTNIYGCPDILRKFTGSIDKVGISQSKDSITAQVSCRDFRKKLINAINENYPNRASYLPKVLSRIDSNQRFDIDHIMPSAFDAWTIFDMVEVLSVHAGIDTKKVNRDLWDTQNYFVLESNLNWPLTTTTNIFGQETKDGDPFVHHYEYGMLLDDLVSKVSSSIGYNYYCDRNGNIIIKEPRATNKVEIYESGLYGSKSVFYSGNWNMGVDISSKNRLFISPDASSFMRFRFSGVGAGLYTTLYPTADNYSVIIKDKNGSEVFNQMYIAASGLEYSHLNKVTADLVRDVYDLYIYPSGINFKLEGFEFYTQNVYKPVYTLKDNRDIISIDVSMDDYSLRNEVITVGQQVSDKGYLYSKSIDIDSISNPDAYNYVGEKRTFVLIEPTIQSQARLDWLSSAVMNRLKSKQRVINVKCQGLPHLEMNDPVGIDSYRISLDSSSESVFDENNNQVYYVNKISSSMDDSNYVTNISLTNLKPIESWRPSLSITTDVMEKIYQANNNTIFANFRQDTLNSTSGYGYDGFSEQGSFVSFDLLIDVDRLWVLIADELDGGAVFKNIDVNSADPLIVYQTQDSSDENAPPKSARWLHDGGGERWGRITVPNANTQSNGEMWIGQNSENKVRLNGAYPIAIWAQFRTADNVVVNQGIWVPTSGTLDDRNRTLAWSSTSEYNTYLAINSASNTSNALLTPVNPSIQLSYLPAFVVNNRPFMMDMYIGPKSSGLKIVENNQLLDMSSFSTHLTGEYNQYTANLPRTPMGTLGTYVIEGNQDFSDGGTRWYTPPPSFSKIGKRETLPNTNSVYAGENVGWRVGDSIMYTGVSPSKDYVKAAIEDCYYYGYVYGGGGGIQYKTLGQKSGYKNVFGFYPMGISYIDIANTGYRDYLTYPRNIYSSTVSSYSGAVETVNHYGNYITIDPKRDIYLTYRVLCPYYKWVGEIPSTSTTSKYGGYLVYENIMFYTLKVYETSISTERPFRAPIGVYLGPGEFHNNAATWGTYNPRNSSQYYKYRGNQNIIGTQSEEINNLIFNLKGNIQWDANASTRPASFADTLIHVFEITDAQTNEKYHFTMRTDRGHMVKKLLTPPPDPLDPSLPNANTFGVVLPDDIPRIPSNVLRPSSPSRVGLREYPRIL